MSKPGDREHPPTPVEAELRRSRARRRWLLAFALVIAGSLVWTGLLLAVPTDYQNLEEHFKYGSIGADTDNGIPYWVWRVLPAVCPEHLATRGDGSSRGYESFGFVSEPGRDRPIGFSKRRSSGIELVGLNCASCHVGTVRTSPSATPEVISTMPAHQLDLLAYFEFLFDCAADPRFTVDTVMAHIDAATDLGPLESFVYRTAIPRVREGLLARAGRLTPLRTDRFRSGKGRIDTFNPYKALVLNFPEVQRSAPGAADLPSVWNQGIRRTMQLHWDGNNDSLFERNISAAIGAGVTPESVDLPRIERIARWLEVVPPPPSRLRAAAAAEHAAGAALYGEHCASCHGEPDREWQGPQVGKVVPLAQIGTDPSRLDSHTYAFASSQWTIGTSHAWRFKQFRKTAGYASMPLDGLWARAPYLHNGSVPTLRDLLATPPAEPLGERRSRTQALTQGRPSEVAQKVAASVRDARLRGERPLLFYRGYDVLDHDRVGFVVDRATDGRRRHTLYDTTREGCHNAGHDYGTKLPGAAKEQLLAYLKTL